MTETNFKLDSPPTYVQLGTLLSTLTRWETEYKLRQTYGSNQGTYTKLASFTRHPTLSAFSSPSLDLIRILHTQLRNASSQIHMQFMQPDNAFYQQLADTPFDWPAWREGKSLVQSNLQSMRTQLGDQSPEGLRACEAALEALPKNPSLANMWEFLTLYRKAYAQLYDASQQPDARQVAYATFDEHVMGPVVRAFARQIQGISEVDLTLQSPEADGKNLQLRQISSNLIKSQNNSLPMSIIALSAGKGMIENHVSPSIYNYVLKQNGLTDSIPKCWSAIGDVCKDALKTQHPEIDADNPALWQANGFAPKPAQMRLLNKAIAEALPDINRQYDEIADKASPLNRLHIEKASNLIQGLESYAAANGLSTAPSSARAGGR